MISRHLLRRAAVGFLVFLLAEGTVAWQQDPKLRRATGRARPVSPSPPRPVASKWRPALPGYRFAFPRDHASHPAFKTEWWYYTGHLRTRKGRTFGFELTFFRFGTRPPGTPGRSAWT